MSEPLKSKIVFDEPVKPEPATAEVELTSQLQFAEQEKTFLPETTDIDQADVEAELDRALRSKPKRRSGWLKGLLVAGAAMVGWQTVDYVVTAYQGGDWLALGWSVIVAGIAGAGITALGRELLSLRRLKQRQSEREQAQALLEADGIGQAKAFCTKLAKQGKAVEVHAGYDKWLNSLAATHNDREVMQLYDRMVLGQQDKLARKLVAKYASEAAVMVAVSPLALADMLLVAWRNFRLIDQISKVYGVELGYWSRIKLVKLVLANMAVAGATEVIADGGMDMLSMDLAGRVSTRVAQGVGVGLLTGRLGLKAISLMRPLPWQPEQQPKLSEIRKDLLTRLTHKDRQD
ncbi:YcjF family protein [Photobacterium rosenbergii]|uniref:YcjF family protein n=1 Tax=Photobacterium rosenbergii TaxID=294936 RepID=UPI001C98F37F|nr:TIGR01620 family protein [Photobacterium rosenbergii]MBY5945426.1 YcjF family protein [Photobacterium rosenbergii]